MKIMLIALMAAFVAAYALYIGAVPGISLGGADLSHMMHTQFEAINPDFMNEAKMACELADGAWTDTPNRVGCFDIPYGGFDASQCASPAYAAFCVNCESVRATCACSNSNVGCYYI